MLNTDSNAPVAVFDWYAATVRVDAAQVEADLLARLGATAKPAKGLHGYPNGTDLMRDGNVIAKMIWGGNQAPHVWASGSDAPDLANHLRDVYPDKHYVTRVDVAYDFIDGEPWPFLYDCVTGVADYSGTERRARPLKLHTLGDWIRKDEGYPGGRTLYLGSLKSPVFARLYEKGKQMRNLFPDQLDKYPEGWVRLELQVRPSGDARFQVAKLEPAAVWGTARWARDLHGHVFGTDLSAVLMAQHRPGDDERAFRFLLTQYGPLLRRRAAADGKPADRALAWAALGVELGQALGSID